MVQVGGRRLGLVSAFDIFRLELSSALFFLSLLLGLGCSLGCRIGYGACRNARTLQHTCVSFTATLVISHVGFLLTGSSD